MFVVIYDSLVKLRLYRESPGAREPYYLGTDLELKMLKSPFCSILLKFLRYFDFFKLKKLFLCLLKSSSQILTNS